MHDSKMPIPGPLLVPASKGRVGKEEEKNESERERGGEVGSGKEGSLDPAVERRKGEGKEKS